MATRIRRRKIDPARIRSRLYRIVLEGDDKDAVNAARVLLRETTDGDGQGPDQSLLEELKQALSSDGL